MTDGFGYFGDQSQNEDNKIINGLRHRSHCMTPNMSDYIREVRVMVWWGEDHEETGDYVEILTHVVNPSGVVTDPEVEDVQ